MSEKNVFIFALIWIGLGAFGLIFDPEKKIIITSQFVLGFSFLIYYLWLKLKNK